MAIGLLYNEPYGNLYQVPVPLAIWLNISGRVKLLYLVLCAGSTNRGYNMTEIYLIRHAEAEGNLYRLWQGRTDGRITPQGRLQIQALAERFASVHLDAIYSSDLQRARETAQGLLKDHPVPYYTDPRLQEFYVGAWENRPFGNTDFEEPEMAHLFNSDPARWHADGAESFFHCQHRMEEVLRDVAEKNDGGTIAVISHGMAIRTLLAKLLGIPSENIEELKHGDNTCVAHILWDGSAFFVDYYNDNSHLPEEISTLAKQDWWRSGAPDAGDLRTELLDPKKEGDLYTHCYRQAWVSAHGNDRGFLSAPYLTSAIQHSRRNPGCVVKFYSLDRFAGLVDLDPLRGRRDEAGWVSLLYLEPEFRYRGLGFQPLGYAVNFFRNMGRSCLRLHAASDNPAALSFYEKAEFRKINVESGIYSDLYLLEKDL